MRRSICILAAAALVAGCGSDDDSGDEKRTPSGGANAVFDSKDVGFTFEYPKDLVAETKPNGQVLGQVSVERGGQLNALKIRKTAEQELGTDRYLDEFQRDFGQTVGKVAKREQKVGELETGVLEFDDTVDQGGKGTKFHSASYFFAGGGKTWQLECIADEKHGDQIEKACMQALESVEFKD